MVVVFADGALEDAGDVVPFVAHLAYPQLFLDLLVVYEPFLIAALYYLVNLGQNSTRCLVRGIPLQAVYRFSQ